MIQILHYNKKHANSRASHILGGLVALKQLLWMANMEASFAGVQIQAQQYYYSKDGNLSKPVQRRRCPEEEDDDMP
jgi:hypothetical protein